jgi:hypothetical protein
VFDYFYPDFNGFNIPAPGANTNILATGITPKKSGTMRVTVNLATGSVFNVQLNQGATNILGSLGSGALAAGAMNSFAFGCNPNTTYNFQVATNGIINYLQVEHSDLGAIY